MNTKAQKSKGSCGTELFDPNSRLIIQFHTLKREGEIGMIGLQIPNVVLEEWSCAKEWWILVTYAQLAHAIEN